MFLMALAVNGSLLSETKAPAKVKSAEAVMAGSA